MGTTHFAPLVNGRLIDDPLTRYLLEKSALLEADSLRQRGHTVVVVPVPRALVMARVAKALAST